MEQARTARSTAVHLLVIKAGSIGAGPPADVPAIMFAEVRESHGRYAH